MQTDVLLCRIKAVNACGRMLCWSGTSWILARDNQKDDGTWVLLSLFLSLLLLLPPSLCLCLFPLPLPPFYPPPPILKLLPERLLSCPEFLSLPEGFELGDLQ